MTPFTVPLSPSRVARCKAIIKGFNSPSDRVIREHVSYLIYSRIDKFLGMMTDEAIEELAFYAINERVSMNRMNARSRAIYAQQSRDQVELTR